MTTNRSFRKSSIKDVARRAGVSTTTVSYFMNGRENVCAPGTAERIRVAVAELQYTPNSLTRGLRQGATRTIGICLASPLDVDVRYGSLFFERLWRGIVREADEAEYSLLHYPSSIRLRGDAVAFLDGRVDGLLFHGSDGGRPEKAAHAGMPVMLVTRSRNLPDGCGTAYVDERRTVGIVLEYLYSLGHKRIAYLAGPVGYVAGAGAILREPADDIAVKRLESYVEQQQAKGYYHPMMVGYADSWCADTERITRIVAAWRALPEPPTAVVCANDALAVGVMEAASALRWNVPEALSVVGVDDSGEARDAAIPLTSVAVPVEEIGREAIRGLVRLMEGEAAETCRVALQGSEIVHRNSVAPPQ